MESFIKAKVLDDWKPIEQAFQKKQGDWKIVDTIQPKINNEYKKIQIHHHDWKYYGQTTTDGHRTDMYKCTCNEIYYEQIHQFSSLVASWDANMGSYVFQCGVTGCDAKQPTVSNILFKKDDINTAATTFGLTKTVTDTGIKFTNQFDTDAYFTLFKNWSDIETGNYLFFKYKSSGATNVQIYTATDRGEPAHNYMANLTLNNDEAWHITFFDLSKLLKDFPTGKNGSGLDNKYYIQHLRLDIQGSYNCWAEFEYIGLTSNAKATAKALGRTDSSSSETCEHSEMLQVPAIKPVNEYSHSEIICGLCGKTLSTEKHQIDYAFWDLVDDRYEVMCPICKGLSVQEYQYIIDYSNFEDGTLPFPRPNDLDSSSYAIKNGSLVMYPNGCEAWGGVSVGIPAGKAGRYYVLKYRVNKGYGYSSKIHIRFNNQTILLSLNNDGNWHRLTYDLGLQFPAQDNLVILNGDHWFNNNADGFLYEYEVAYEAFLDDLSRLPCDHIPFEPVMENEIEATCTDPGGHDLVTRCSICNKILNSQFVKTASKLGHNYNNNGVCSRCGNIDDGEWIWSQGTESYPYHYQYWSSDYSRQQNRGSCNNNGGGTLSIGYGNDSKTDFCERYGRRCTICDGNAYWDYTTKQHDWTEWYAINGLYHTRECRRHSHSYDWTSEHEMDWIYSDDTYHKYACKICGYESVSAKHNWQYVAEVSPSCEFHGLTAGRVCSDCGSSNRSTIPPLGHDVSYFFNRTATQHQEYSYCDRCKQVTWTGNWEDHDFGNDPRYPSNCICGQKPPGVN